MVLWSDDGDFCRFFLWVFVLLPSRLSFNHLTGTIPTALASLSKLHTLYGERRSGV